MGPYFHKFRKSVVLYEYMQGLSLYLPRCVVIVWSIFVDS